MTHTIIPNSLSPQITMRAEFVAGFAADLPPLNDIINAVAMPQEITAAITAVHRLQRAYFAAKIGLLGSNDVLAAIDHADFPLWHNYAALPASDAQKDMLAKLMYEGDVKRRTPILLSISDYSRDIAERILERCIAEGDAVDLYVSDPLFQRRLLTHASEEQAIQLGQLILALYENPDARTISLRIEQIQQTFPDPPAAATVQQAFNAAINNMAGLSRSRFYTVTVLPTPSDAALDQISYPDYIDLFFRMCDVDWTAVSVAHHVLIAQLDIAKHLRFTNHDGTDVSMNIDGFTFCNSLVAKNVPGSEVFSAPHRDNVEGVVVGKGRYLFAGKLMENIRLRFEHGRIVEYSAEIGHDVLTQMIETDEDSHYVGEIGIGTNPVLRTHLVNGLVVEKIGGSFHLAIGHSYKFTDYLGIPVMVDNGNNSAIHEDLTFMLYGKNGKMYVDDQLIMDDGRFLDPRLAVLNGMH